MNTFTEGIDELLHGLGEIDEIRGKIGGFSRTPKPQFEGTRESKGFRTRIEGLEAPQGITKMSRINLSTCAQDPTKENRIHPKTKDKACEIDLLPKPRRAQGGLGLLSRSISVQESQRSISKILILEKRRKNREEGRAPGQGALVQLLEKRASERERGGEGVFNPNNSQPQKTKLPLDSIKH